MNKYQKKIILLNKSRGFLDIVKLLSPDLGSQIIIKKLRFHKKDDEKFYSIQTKDLDEEKLYISILPINFSGSYKYFKQRTIFFSGK